MLRTHSFLWTCCQNDQYSQLLPSNRRLAYIPEAKLRDSHLFIGFLASLHAEGV